MMEMDSNELERFLAANSGGFDIAQTLSTQNLSAQAAAAGIGSQNGGERSGPVINPDQSSGSVDMDEIVAENDREMRRRSLANGFGMGFLNVTDTDPGGSFSQMVSPTYSQSPISAELSQISSQMSSTMEGYSGLNSTSQQNMGAVAMMGVGSIAGSELSSSMPMYSDQQSTAHQNSGQNGLVAMSVAPTSAVKMASGPLASSPNTSRMSGSSMSHTTIPPQMHMPQISEAPSIDRNSTADPMTGAQYTQMETKPQPSIFNETTYSSTGFDMLGILYQVANRPNPQINIGCVDLSCSFVVTDARKFDNPIVYCSSTFERLTGYTKHEILGRNCRFLQAPDGKIVPGVKRKYVDDDSVYYIKNRIMCNKEAQTSLINYRKGGQPFTNLLTMIPIAWNSPDISHFVGFQVDLVDQPGAMVNKNRDGTYSINYQYSQMPTYIPTGTATVVDKRSGTTVARDDVTQVLSSFGTADSEFHSKRILDKVLLENTDDVVHVLSLKGLFLYCSQSVRKVLEYDPQELVGSSLSGICHPSDIVPVTRDLKDTSAGSSVNVVFRIRRKYSGYTWFESHGCLHTEQGKGRKCIILVGRERPVYVLSWKDITASGGIGENELWTKMSTSGMFLYVSSNSKMLLDREGEELLGTSIQALMRPDSKNEIGTALENARAGVKATVRHEIQNKRGQFLQALTTLFPGDGNENQRPTFLIAQTRLLKHTRASASSPIIKSVAQQQAEALVPVHGTASLWSNATPAQPTQASGERSGSVGSAENGSDGPEDNLFDELKTTRSTSWQFELRQMQRTNKRLIEELTSLLALKKKRKRRKGADQMEKDCANCHTRVTPEWRRGPSGKRDLCNSCGLRYAKLVGRVSPRTTTSSDKGNTSPAQSSALQTAQQQSLTIDTSSPLVSSAGKNPSSHQQQQHPQQQHPHHHPHPHPQHNISMHNPPSSSSNNSNNNTLCSPSGGGSSGGGGGGSGSGSMQNLAPMPPAQKIRRMSFAGVSSNGMAPIQLHPGSGQQQQQQQQQQPPLSGQMDLGGG